MWDVFISHALEDRDAVALPLAEELRRRKMRVWFDRFALAVGDPLAEKIEEGLKKSRCGVVVLSHAFFAKEWPRRELDGLLSRGKRILPVWHGLTGKDVKNYSLVLANRVAVSTDGGIEAVAAEIEKVVRARRRLFWAKILAITLFFLLLAFVAPLVQRLTLRTDRVADAPGFVITTPRESQEVDPGVEVRGRTPYPALHHYVVVTSIATGGAWVQLPAATVSSAHTFSGPAQVGTATTGGSQKFRIEVFATRERLGPGRLTIPGDARFSQPVTVVRKP